MKSRHFFKPGPGIWAKKFTHAHYVFPPWSPRVTAQSRSPFSASLQTFCLTVRAYLNTQKYGPFCSLGFYLRSRDPCTNGRTPFLQELQARHRGGRGESPRRPLTFALELVWHICFQCFTNVLFSWVGSFHSKEWTRQGLLMISNSKSKYLQVLHISIRNLTTSVPEKYGAWVTVTCNQAVLPCLE